MCAMRFVDKDFCTAFCRLKNAVYKGKGDCEMTVKTEGNVRIGFTKMRIVRGNHVDYNLFYHSPMSWGYPCLPRMFCSCFASGNDDSRLIRWASGGGLSPINGSG